MVKINSSNSNWLDKVDRVEFHKGGNNHVLVLSNTIEEDTGTYMCYATNSMGSAIKSLEITSKDIILKTKKNNITILENQSDLEVKMQDIKDQLDKERESLLTLRNIFEEEVKDIKQKITKKAANISLKSSNLQHSAIEEDLGNLC